jgi:hypothetical protein
MSKAIYFLKIFMMSDRFELDDVEYSQVKKWQISLLYSTPKPSYVLVLRALPQSTILTSLRPCCGTKKIAMT